MRTRRWTDWLLGAGVVAFAAVSMLTVQQGIGTEVRQLNSKCDQVNCNALPQVVQGNCTCDFSNATGVVSWCFDNSGTVCFVPDTNVLDSCSGRCVGNPNMFCSQLKLECH
jgi:hypothetical protein